MNYKDYFLTLVIIALVAHTAIGYAIDFKQNDEIDYLQQKNIDDVKTINQYNNHTDINIDTLDKWQWEHYEYHKEHDTIMAEMMKRLMDRFE